MAELDIGLRRSPDVTAVVAALLRGRNDEDQLNICLAFAETGLRGSAFILGRSAAAEYAYTLADTLATGGHE